MATIAQSIRIDDDLVALYDDLAAATGRPRNQLYVEALRQYVRTEGWQITEVRRTLASLANGLMPVVDGGDVVARFLAEGRVTRQTLAEAEERYGIPPEHQSS